MFTDTDARDEICLPEDLSKPLNERNRIFIRRELSFGQKARVNDACLEVRIENGEATPSMSIGMLGLALMKHYVVDWAGPAFAGRKCNEENIEKLSDRDPLVRMVAKELGERWSASQSSMDPKDEQRALINGESGSEVSANQ